MLLTNVELLLNIRFNHQNQTHLYIKMEMDSTSKITQDPESYYTPFCTHLQYNHQHHQEHSRIFIDRKKKYKINFVRPHNIQNNLSNQEDVLPKSAKASLTRLAEWLRLSVISLGVSKHVFDNAIALLAQGSHKMETTYALAAACLVIAVKFQHGVMISKYKELPVRTANQVPKVHISDAAKVQGHLLNALGFQIPFPSSKSQFLLTLTENWNVFLRHKQRKINIPFKMLYIGFEDMWQKRNMACAGYLLDILSTGASGHFSRQQIYLTSALVVIGAVNCSQCEYISSQNYILVKLAKIFLGRFYKTSKQQQQQLMLILSGILSHKLHQKLSLVPAFKQQRQNFQSREAKLEWLNKLQNIPYEENFGVGYKK